MKKFHPLALSVITALASGSAGLAQADSVSPPSSLETLRLSTDSADAGRLVYAHDQQSLQYPTVGKAPVPTEDDDDD